MTELLSVSKAKAHELDQAFRDHVGRLEISTESAKIACAVGGMALNLWCWMRDAIEVEASPESIDFVTRQDGVARITQFIKRRDVPKDLIDQSVKVLFEFGKPVNGGLPFELWIGTLHEQCMSSFARRLKH